MNILVFDIGGTTIKYGFCRDGILEQTLEVPTEAQKGGPHIVNTLLSLAKGFPSFDAIGISTAGQVDSSNGSIIYANSNIPNYTGTRLSALLEEAFQIPVAVENDVNAAALGEAVYGAGKEHESFLCLTYGTGVGGAIVENRKIYHGASFSAGEFGGIVTHGSLRLSGNDFFDGCYERFASTTALVKLASTLDPSLTNGRIIFENLHRPEVLEVLHRWIDEILLGLVTITHIFNPSCIVLGGGIMVQPYIIQRIQKLFPSYVMPSFSKALVLPAKLGNSAGLLGAYHLASLKL